MAQTLTQQILSNFAQPSLSGAIGAVAVSQMFPESSNFVALGTSVPLPALGFGLGFGSQFVSNIVSNFILPHLSESKKLQHLESMVLTVGSSAAAFAVIPRILNENIGTTSTNRLLVSGAAVEVLSRFLWDGYIGEALGLINVQ